ncbi:hypothetical protein ACJMK2_006474 [Sinanodonta woodiana]|uniref:Uncharacterized protein n=1 Tax=Sinanodonta woodiana TaxID=1069815 RepID=A0ABD3VUL4_SINWO
MEVKRMTMFCILMIVLVVGARPNADLRKQCIALPIRKLCVSKQKNPNLDQIKHCALHEVLCEQDGCHCVMKRIGGNVHA